MKQVYILYNLGLIDTYSSSPSIAPWPYWAYIYTIPLQRIINPNYQVLLGIGGFYIHIADNPLTMTSFHSYMDSSTPTSFNMGITVEDGHQFTNFKITYLAISWSQPGTYCLYEH